MGINGNFESADHYLATHEVGPHQHGIRLDAFLKERYTKRSRESLKRAIDAGVIRVERTGGPHLSVGKLKPSYQLVPGDRIGVMSERKPEPAVNFDYKIIYEDDTLFVINKPANLPVHPAGRYFFNTLLVHLKTENDQDPQRAEHEHYLVHRLDKETSGVLVLSKDREVCTALSRQFAARQTEKRYYAIVKGHCPEEFEVNAPLGRRKGSVIEIMMAVVPEAEGGQTASTRFRRLETAGDYSLVECFPKTGRQHQIRVHLWHAGHAIVGDKLYGIPEEVALTYANRERLTPENEALLILPRHALHSCALAFTNPTTGKRVEFRSELPDDLRAFLNQMRGRPGAADSTKSIATFPVAVALGATAPELS